MSAPPFMPLFVADYLGDTRHLSTEQHGAYLLLLMAMWRGGGSLPDEASRLARLVGLGPARWAKVSPEVLDLFERQDGGLSHGRLRKEMARYTQLVERRAQAGVLGAQAKALKSQKASQAKGDPLLQQPEPQPQPDSEAAASETRMRVSHDRPDRKRDQFAQRLADIDAAMAAAVERGAG